MNDFTPEPRRKVGRPSNAEVQARAEVQAAESQSAATARAAEVMQRRRRRETLGPERNLKLHVPQEMKDPNYEYRWVNDRPGRIMQLTQYDDWDKAPEMEGIGLGTTTERVADKYTGERTVLLRKPKEFYDADKAAEQKVLDERDDAMRRGPPPSNEQGSAELGEYVPGGRNIINGR